MSNVMRGSVGKTTSKHPLVSIVIPFYNLESTVSRCLDTVLSQTFDDYEVICVDDGSTDNTGKLLDEYQSTYERIRVIHQANHGLSAARNHGVEVSKGYFVSFVDGDDIIAPSYLQLLVEAMGNAGNRLVIGTSKPIPEQRLNSKRPNWPTFNQPKLVTREQACHEILIKPLLTSAWAKLFNRDYYQNNPFPTGVRYEEIRTIGKLIASSDEVSFVNAPIYGYVLREGSIVRAHNASGEQGLEYIEAILIALDDFAHMGYTLNRELAFFKALMFTKVHDFTNRISDSEASKTIADVAQTAVRESWREAIFCSGSSKAQRARIALFRGSPSLYDKIMDAYNHQIKGV